MLILGLRLVWNSKVECNSAFIQVLAQDQLPTQTYLHIQCSHSHIEHPLWYLTKNFSFILIQLDIYFDKTWSGLNNKKWKVKSYSFPSYHIIHLMISSISGYWTGSVACCIRIQLWNTKWSPDEALFSKEISLCESGPSKNQLLRWH